jgi:hypothetical protein
VRKEAHVCVRVRSFKKKVLLLYISICMGLAFGVQASRRVGYMQHIEPLHIMQRG